MPTYLDANGNPIQSQKVYLDPSTGEPIALAKPSLDLSNPNRQGVYQMKDAQGQAVGVPYGEVQKAAQLGYGFANDADRFRFAKDNAADPNRVTSFNPAGSDPRASVQYQQQLEANAPLAVRAVGGIAKGGATLMRPALDVVAAATHASPQEVDDMLAARSGVERAAKIGTIGAAVVPAAVAAPLATAGALGGGTVGAAAGQLAGTLANLSPTQTQLLSDVGGLAGGVAGGVGGNRLSGSIKTYWRPTPSPDIVPQTEMAARQLSAAILPAGKDSPGFIRAAQEETPNVIAYAKQTGNPLNTQIEFAKAAKGYANEALDLKSKIEAPLGNQLVKTTGTGFGSRMHEGPDTFATIPEIDARIVSLNKQLDAPAANADDARRALASKEDLQREVRGLTDIRNNVLAKASGLTPDQVANVFQRSGRAYELANDTDAAVTQRMNAEGKREMGPISWTQLPSRAVEFARGGPTAIADRAFQRALASFTGEAQPLPQLGNPVQQMTPSIRPSLAQAAGIDAEPNPLQAVPMSAEDSRSQVTKMNRSLARRESSIQDTLAQKREEAQARFRRQQELLATARAQQQLLRKR